MHLMALRAFCLAMATRLSTLGKPGLNAPYDAPCYLTRLSCRGGVLKKPRLNAPYDAPRFLTIVAQHEAMSEGMS